MLQGMPRPRPDHDTKPFWDACGEGRLVVPRCGSCGTTRWPPGPMCPVCQSTEIDWIESDGSGSVYSWVVVTHPTHPDLADQVPYVIALIDLPEGVRILTNLDGVEPAAIAAGMPVELYFDDHDLPQFRSVEGRP